MWSAVWGPLSGVADGPAPLAPLSWPRSRIAAEVEIAVNSSDRSAVLTERDESILAFESRPWHEAGDKEQAIRVEFGITAARYYQMLNTLIESPAAIRYDPMLVARLRRMRSGRLHTDHTVN